MLSEWFSKQKIKRHTLCHSLAGNRVEYIHVTNPSVSSSANFPPSKPPPVPPAEPEGKDKTLTIKLNGVKDKRKGKILAESKSTAAPV